MSQAVQLARYEDAHRRTPVRDRTERLLQLSEYLPTHERLLLTQVLEHGLSAADIARLTDDKPDCVRRRIRRLMERLDSPLFRFAASRFELLPRDLQTTARRHILEGHSLRKTAQLTGLSLHRIRQQRRSLETLAKFF